MQSSRHKQPFVLADSSYIDSCFNLSIPATSPQRPLSSFPKVLVVKMFNCTPPVDVLYGVADFLRLQLYERVGISQVEVYEKVGRSVV